MIAVSLPRDPADTATVVVPAGEEAEGMLDAAVIGDRLLALYSTELRVYRLDPAPPELFDPPE